jgi:hypothetical protein
MSHFNSWELLFGLGLVVVGLALAFGLYQQRTRNRANDAVSDEAARLLREHSPEQYEREDKPRLEREVARNERRQKVN